MNTFPQKLIKPVMIVLALFAALAQALYMTPAYAETRPQWTTPPPLSGVTTMHPEMPAMRSGKWIEVILAQQRLIAWEDGHMVMTSAISSGTRAHPTVRGTFKIYARYTKTRMRGPGYNLPNVPYTMYFYRGYALHGAYWHNNFGHPMSHGCVNLPIDFSHQLYAWAPNGTLVVIH